jgi:hypothetical protein
MQKRGRSKVFEGGFWEISGKATAEERGHGNLECQSRAVQKRG